MDSLIASDSGAVDLRQMAQTALLGEAEAIASLAAPMASDIERAARLLCSVKGRVVVTGIGKSGHIGSKIAATFSSLGKPSHFIHASEASHGDLGALTSDDIVLALSNSGETSELSDFIAYCTQWSIPLVAITGNGASALARAATMSLVYPAVKEVCAIGRAPTTSTIVMMAIGDAIAVLLTHLLGTTDEHFTRHHPGGSLGMKLKKVSELMHAGDQLPVVEAGTLMHEAIVVMSRKGFGSAIVRNGQGVLAGVITDGDLRRMGPTLWQSTADQVANYNPLSVGQHELVEDALLRMREKMVTCLLVRDLDNQVVGLIHIHDCLRGGF